MNEKPKIEVTEGSRADWDAMQDMKGEVEDCAIKIARLLGVLAVLFIEKHGQFSIQHLLQALTLAGLAVIEMAYRGEEEKVEGVLKGWGEMVGEAKIADHSKGLKADMVERWLMQGREDVDRTRAEVAIGAALSAYLHQPKKGDSIN